MRRIIGIRLTMDTNIYCDPCSDEGHTIKGVKYCSDCEEKLCQTCADSHLRFRAFKSHHLIDLLSTYSKLPPPTKTSCEIHPNFQLDFFCKQHDIVCCGACMPDVHKHCEDVLPLKVASRDIKTPFLLTDTIKTLESRIETLHILLQNRKDNRTLICNHKSLITEQIRELKRQFIQQINQLETDAMTELDEIYQKNEKQIKKDEKDVASIAKELDDNKQILNFLKDHGSDNQLFIAIREQLQTENEKEKVMSEIVSNIQEVDIEFIKQELNIKSFGFFRQVTKPCRVQLKPEHTQAAQVQFGSKTALTEFKKEKVLKMRIRENCNYICGMAVTSENTLILCNDYMYLPVVCFYKDCATYEKEIPCSRPPYNIAVLPGRSKAVVTIPDNNSVQFINTKNYKKEGQVKLPNKCYGITATKDMIFAGGKRNIHILKHDGSLIRSMTTRTDYIYNLCYNERKNQVLLRCDREIRCISLDGTEVYKYNLSGYRGLTLDHDGYVYACDVSNHEIHRLSPNGEFHDVVLKQENDLYYPNQIMFNKDCTKLFVINNYQTLSVYTCK